MRCTSRTAISSSDIPSRLAWNRGDPNRPEHTYLGEEDIRCMEYNALVCPSLIIEGFPLDGQIFRAESQAILAARIAFRHDVGNTRQPRHGLHPCHDALLRPAIRDAEGRADGGDDDGDQRRRRCDKTSRVFQRGSKGGIPPTSTDHRSMGTKSTYSQELLVRARTGASGSDSASSGSRQAGELRRSGTREKVVIRGFIVDDDDDDDDLDVYWVTQAICCN
ncbi:hypothetical protein F4811DRAFT_567700 [Daldinia bambusicola]|nr:hypothetical protein F4811DRAFT_567700 [Daldinia bambusicola]